MMRSSHDNKLGYLILPYLEGQVISTLRHLSTLNYIGRGYQRDGHSWVTTY